MNPCRWLAALFAGFALSSWGLQPAFAAPVASNVDIQLSALRLKINDYTTRYQLKLVATIISEDEAETNAISEARLQIITTGGETLTFEPHKVQLHPKQFKAARGVAMFKVIEDTSEPEISNVPDGFLSMSGQAQLVLQLASESFAGEVSFLAPVAVSVTQSGDPTQNFTLAMEKPFTVLTDPAEFGPVYYKRQDLTNFVFQLANIDQALAGGDFHAPIESPQYLFQVQVSDGEGGPSRLVPPGRYIDGFSLHMIRSEKTATPLVFQPDEYREGEVVVIDFQRKDTLPPDTVFAGPGSNLTSRVVVINRAIYALAVEAPPSPSELGLIEELTDGQ